MPIKYEVPCPHAHPVDVRIGRHTLSVIDHDLGQWQAQYRGRDHTRLGGILVDRICSRVCPQCPKHERFVTISQALAALDIPSDCSQTQAISATRDHLKFLHPDTRPDTAPIDTTPEFIRFNDVLTLIKDPQAWALFQKSLSARSPLKIRL